MMSSRLFIYSIAAALTLSATHISRAADDRWSFDRDSPKGRWRTDITSSTGTIANQCPDREEDYFVLGSVEYEWPICSLTTCSLRGSPLFLYNLHGKDNYDSTHIYGAAFGLALRLYEKKDLTGLFAEVGSSPLWHSDYFLGNSSKLNFITDVGVGYEFKNHISVAAKYFHISNAGLGEHNSGLDAIGISLAYAF